MDMTIEKGKIYEVNHSRKGRFTMLTTTVSDEWVTGEIQSGEAEMLSQVNPNKQEGETISVRRSLAQWKEVKQ